MKALAIGCVFIVVSQTIHAADLPSCSLTIYPVLANGELAHEALISRPDVVGLENYGEDLGGCQLWKVSLTQEAAMRNLEFTTKHLGAHLAVLCNGKEIVRPRIMAPSAEQFIFSTCDSP